MSEECPAAPDFASLPPPRHRFTRGGKDYVTFELRVEVVTPILGGGTEPRTVDEVDVIRAPAVRGHLRFWWRALRGHEFQNAEELFRAESLLWGNAAEEGGGRSAVAVRIRDVTPREIDRDDIHPRKGEKTPGAYALWPARSEKRRGIDPAPRYKPGTRFRMQIAVPKDYESEVRDTIRAWLTFGGYGSRTRRGLGSLRVIENGDAWLPHTATREAFARLFQRDIFAAPGRVATDVPWLAGAWLHVGQPLRDAMRAWTTALGWLEEFRQGTSGSPGYRAREPGTGKPQPNRPSWSNWPEADKVRHLAGKTASHPPRHNGSPVWPRAGFGLPIIGQFQKRGRQGEIYDEPNDFELCWRLPQPDSAEGFEPHDRLASPLIVKAMPLAGGTFVPCALWLNRAYPEGGEVVLFHIQKDGHKERDPNSAAPFDRLVAPGDRPQFLALDGKGSLRAAFLDWLRARCHTAVVAP